MSEIKKPSASGSNGPQTSASSGNINVTASEGGYVSANTLAGCIVQGNVIMGTALSTAEPAPDKEEFRKELKRSLQRKYQYVCKDTNRQGKLPLLSDIYTDQDVTISADAETSEETIKCADIFKSKTDKEIRTVLTKGITGTGKSVSVQKFILDWAEGKSNQDVDFVFPIPFRDLNNKKKNTSLLQLLKEFFPQIHSTFLKSKCKTVIILDGLNEYCSSLNFKSDVFCNIEQEASVNVLLVNLLKGNLLDGALLWVTSRPAAASQLPPETVHVVTELKGFNDQQKEEYFRKVHKGHAGKAEEVISYMTKSSSLRVLCDIPDFCRILSIVLKDTEVTFRSWTGLLAHFLCEHIHQQQESETGTGEKMILNLGKLAWKLLEKDETTDFGVNDLKACGIDAQEHAVFSGVCTEISQSESEAVRSDDRKFCFFDRSFQQFLAAVYVILSFACHKKNPVQETTAVKRMATPTLFDVHKSALRRAVKTRRGQFDGFVKFLLGLSEESNQKFVQKFIDCIAKSQSTPLKWEQDINKTVKHISKTLNEENVTPDRSSKLLEFLHELKDKSLPKKIKEYIHRNESEHLNQDLIILLQTDEGIQEEFEMKSFKKVDTDVTKLIPVVKMSNRVKLNRCNLTPQNCDKLAKSLKTPYANVTQMELSENMLKDSHIKCISSMLQDRHCKIERISFVSCGLTTDSCESLSQALTMEKSCLRELDLSNNDLGDQGVFALFVALGDPKCTLETLKLVSCQLTAKACGELSSGLKSPDSRLKHLDLSFNNLQDSGIQQLSASISKLQTLKLVTCSLTEVSGQYIGVLLQSQTLKELDLTNNKLKDSGVEQFFSKGLASPDCALEKLILKRCGITLQDQSCSKAVSMATKSENCHLRELDLSYNHLQDSGAQALLAAVVNAPSKIEKLSLECCGLTEKTCEFLCSELDKERLTTSCLREINLSDNVLKAVGLSRLCNVLKETVCTWRKLCLSLCSIEADGFRQLANALRKNPFHMEYLDLRFNHPGENGEKMFQSLVEDSNNALKEIRMEHGGEFRLRKGEDRYECTLTLDEDTAHQRLFLTDRKIRWGEWEVPAPQLSDRFDCRTQVLCKETLTGRCYWEVKWSGLVSIGVAYAGMARKGDGPNCTLGRNRHSWCLDCSDYKYTAFHDSKETAVPQPPSRCHRVGVYLDSLGGILAFFKIKTDGKQRQFALLHHFKHDFCLPLYAAFRVWCDSSVYICGQMSDKKLA